MSDENSLWVALSIGLLVVIIMVISALTAPGIKKAQKPKRIKP